MPDNDVGTRVWHFHSFIFPTLNIYRYRKGDQNGRVGTAYAFINISILRYMILLIRSIIT